MMVLRLLDAARLRLARWLTRGATLEDARLLNAHFGEHSITLSPAGLGDVIRWSATQAALAAGDIGMDVATGSPKVFTSGASRSLASVNGQLGGTGASPTVIGITETGGPTALTIGSIADTLTLVRSGTSVIGGLGISSGTFSPTVTLVGGAGNTVPQFSVNLGYYVKIGVWVFYEIELSGDGGNEGAGTGTVAIALPFTSATDEFSSNVAIQLLGRSTTTSGGSGVTCGAQIGASVSVISLKQMTGFGATAALTGADYSNTTRAIFLRGNYRASS